jgi:phosphatidylserine decarboxylase
MIDRIIIGPPRVQIAEVDGNVIQEPVGVPLYALFDLLSNTSAAYDLFRKSGFNDALRDLLNYWGTYLADENRDSNSSLTDKEDGWFSERALQMLESENRGVFNKTYVCPDPNAVNRGFTTFDAFFTRKFQDGVRPVDAPENRALIHNACESTVYRIARGVQLHDRFWLKGQSYSLYDMLNRDDEYADKFINGTVYQAFLSPLDYHRWHAPIDGQIVRAYVVPGTYYAALPDAGAEVDDPDLESGDPRGALIRSQGFLNVVATRALIFIMADNRDIGLMCFIGVGMAEVSSCDITVSEGQVVKTGEELGMFHFGGSSHSMIFGPQAAITFADVVEVDQHLLVNSIIAQVQGR